ncbi:MAG TPA: hypothetical protein VGE15_07670 [Sphingobacteriaceae bacterium]
MKSKKKVKKHYSLSGHNYSASDNNVGTVGQIGYSNPGGKGSYKKMTEILKQSPNTQGIGENEEFHSSY